MNYYIADTHFGHENVLKFDKRPFRSVDEMDEVLITCLLYTSPSPRD